MPALRIEQLPKWLLCIPLVLHWFWLGARWRSLTLPSAANPRIPTGGLAGESKAECLAQIDARHASRVAAWRKVSPGEDALAIRHAASLAYPLIAKPDIGWCGYGVRLLHDDAALAAYVAAFPREGAFILQRYAAGPHEAGLQYVRWPGEPHGSLVAITLRHAPGVTGDGTRTVAALLSAAPDAACRAGTLTLEVLASIPASGERVAVTTVASLRVGGRYEDATSSGTPCLAARIDVIARSMGAFHAGRFDVRFTTLAALRRGEFTIIEVNGAGSEAIHLWDPALPIVRAFAGIFANQAMLFRLGDAMRKRGNPPVGVAALSRAWLAQQRLIARYPPSN